MFCLEAKVQSNSIPFSKEVKFRGNTDPGSTIIHYENMLPVVTAHLLFFRREHKLNIKLMSLKHIML